MLRDLPKLTVLKHEKNLGLRRQPEARVPLLHRQGLRRRRAAARRRPVRARVLAHLYAPHRARRSRRRVRVAHDAHYGGPLKGGMPLYKYVGNRSSPPSRTARSACTSPSSTAATAPTACTPLRNDRSSSTMTDDFHFDTEIIIKLHHQGFRIDEVPIPTYYGDEICYVNGMKYAKDVVRAVMPLPADRARSIDAPPGVRRVLRPLSAQARAATPAMTTSASLVGTQPATCSISAAARASSRARCAQGGESRRRHRLAAGGLGARRDRATTFRPISISGLARRWRRSAAGSSTASCCRTCWSTCGGRTQCSQDCHAVARGRAAG